MGPVDDYGGKTPVARGIVRMASFELVETGLTADKFVMRRSEQSLVTEPTLSGGPAAPERVSPRDRVLRGDKGLAGSLSVKALNFVNALAEMNGGNAVDVRFLEIHPFQVALEGWRHPDSTLVRYHLVCESSERAHVISGDKRQPLNAGDLFRVIHENEPTIFHGGEAGSLIFVVSLKRTQTSFRHTREPSSQLATARSGLSNQAMRWGAAS